MIIGDEKWDILQYDDRTMRSENSHPVSSPSEAPKSIPGNVKSAAETVAEKMVSEVRVLCWIMTGPLNHQTKAMTVKETWGKRCNMILFMSSKTDDILPSVALPVQEGRDHLWAKTREAFTYIHENNFLDHVDWVLKADDDTFVIMENLRHLLSPYDPEKTMYIGINFKPYTKRGFMGGGSGYILSRNAARRFVEEALPGNNSCSNKTEKYEDVEMARCMLELDAEFVDTRDAEGKQRFFPYTPEKHMDNTYDKKLDWLKEFLYHPMEKGMNCCSSSAVSFHYVSPPLMRAMYYLIYNLKPFGLYEVSSPDEDSTVSPDCGSSVIDPSGKKAVNNGIDTIHTFGV